MVWVDDDVCDAYGEAGLDDGADVGLGERGKDAQSHIARRAHGQGDPVSAQVLHERGILHAPHAMIDSLLRVVCHACRVVSCRGRRSRRVSCVSQEQVSHSREGQQSYHAQLIQCFPHIRG